MSNWFVAFPVPAGDWFSGLPQPPAGTRLLAAADLHLTLAFLGSVDEARARAAFAALPRAAIQSLDIVLGAVVPMGNPRRPSALSAKVDGADPGGRSIAERLASPRDSILAAADLPAEKRAMKPHVTLARVRRKASSEERRRALAWVTQCDLASIRIELDRLGLYTAARDPGVRAYDIIETRVIAGS